MPPALVQPLVGLEAAARFTRSTGLAVWVVVRRQPGVVSQARVMGDRHEVEVKVRIDLATIAVRFTPVAAAS